MYPLFMYVYVYAKQLSDGIHWLMHNIFQVGHVIFQPMVYLFGMRIPDLPWHHCCHFDSKRVKMGPSKSDPGSDWTLRGLELQWFPQRSGYGWLWKQMNYPWGCFWPDMAWHVPGETIHHTWPCKATRLGFSAHGAQIRLQIFKSM